MNYFLLPKQSFDYKSIYFSKNFAEILIYIGDLAKPKLLPYGGAKPNISLNPCGELELNRVMDMA